MTDAKTITCYGRSSGRGSTQEWYETASRDAGRRARQLRKLGYTVTVSGMGTQVTRVGLVKMTLLTILGENAHESPAPDRIERC